MKINLKNRLNLLLISLLFSSCYHEDFNFDKLSTDIEFNPKFAIPVGYSNITVKKLLEDNDTNQVVSNNNGFLQLVYNQHVFSLKAKDEMKIASQKADANFNSPTFIPTSQMGGQSHKFAEQSIETNFSFSEGEEQGKIDSIIIKKMQLNIIANSSLNGNIKVEIPNLIKEGKAFSQTIDFTNGNSVYSDFENSVLVFNNTSKENAIEIKYTITLNIPEGNQNDINQGDEIASISVGFSELEYKSMYGYLGKQVIDIYQDTIGINLYDDIGGTFHFANPQLNIRMKNSYGLPIGFAFSRFDCETMEDGVIQITGSEIPTQGSPKILAYPNLNEIGETKNDSIKLNSQTTNLFSVTEKTPKQLIFSISGNTNPQSENIYNFVTDESQYDVDVEMILPLYGYADMMMVNDTLEFNFNDFYEDEVEELKKILFGVSYENTFPIEVSTQVYFTDENYMVLDSLFDNTEIIKSGEDTSGNDGIIDTPTKKITSVLFNNQRIKNIDNAKYIITNAKFKTFDVENQTNVKFYLDYALKIKIGLQVEIEGNTGS